MERVHDGYPIRNKLHNEKIIRYTDIRLVIRLTPTTLPKLINKSCTIFCISKMTSSRLPKHMTHFVCSPNCEAKKCPLSPRYAKL
jgi:hypothetical protein